MPTRRTVCPGSVRARTVERIRPFITSAPALKIALSADDNVAIRVSACPTTSAADSTLGLRAMDLNRTII